VQLGTIDALLAQLCIHHHLTILTTDGDFGLAAQHCPLKVWAPRHWGRAGVGAVTIGATQSGATHVANRRAARRSYRDERRLQKMRFHMIDVSQVAALKWTDTKMLAHSPFLDLLREQGRTQAGAWLAEHFQGVGRRSTVDVRQWFS